MNNSYNRAPIGLEITARELQEADNIYDCDEELGGYVARENEREWLDLDRQAHSHTFKYEE